MFRTRSIFLFLHISIVISIDGTKVHSNVIELNDRFLEVMDQGFWFVEFYAPWCAHCKKLLPVWEHMAHFLADRHSPIRVGKVDCTRFTSVSAALHIHGYPTIIFFRNGIQIPYEGERRKEELVKFAEKCAGPVISRIENREKFDELWRNSDKEPFFVFYDPALRAEEENSSEQALWKQFESVSDSLFTEVNFYEIRARAVFPERLKLPGNDTTVLVFKDNDYLASFDPENNGKDPIFLMEWVKKQRWPLMPQITASNIHTIADSTGKLLVMSPIDGIDRRNTSTDSGRFFNLLMQTADEARKDLELEKHFQFGWIDGNQIANGIVMGTLPVPNFLVFNLSSYEYYLSSDQPSQMTSQSLLLFLHSIRQGEVQVNGGRAWITRLKRMVYEVSSNVYDMFHHQPILTVCLFGVPLAFFSIITYSICSADFSVERDDIFPPDDEDEDEDSARDEDQLSHSSASYMRQLADGREPLTADFDSHEKAD